MNSRCNLLQFGLVICMLSAGCPRQVNMDSSIYRVKNGGFIGFWNYNEDLRFIVLSDLSILEVNFEETGSRFSHSLTIKHHGSSQVFESYDDELVFIMIHKAEQSTKIQSRLIPKPLSQQWKVLDSIRSMGNAQLIEDEYFYILREYFFAKDMRNRGESQSSQREIGDNYDIPRDPKSPKGKRR